MVKKIFALSVFILITANASGAEIVLNQKKVAELALREGFASKEKIYQYDAELFDLSRYLTKYDWNVNLETGQTLNRTEDFNNYDQNAKFQQYDTRIGLKKNFLTTGTTLSFDANRISRKAEYSANAPQFSNSGDFTQDLYGITLEQNLLRNFFGMADRAGRRAIDYRLEASSIRRSSDLQENVLTAVRAFWNAYVAQENFKESPAARERYEKLVDSIRRKSSLGYAKPGELSQVQAELEQRLQTSKKSSTEYLKQIDDLMTSLNLPRGNEIKFEVTEQMPPPPELPAIDPQQSRPLRAQTLAVKSADAALTEASSNSYPAVKLVGQAYQSGVDRSPAASFAEATSGSNPKYYVGVKVEYNFGSSYQSEDQLNKRITKSLEEIRLVRQERETQDKLDNALRKVQSSYNIAQSAQRARDFRERAVREFNNTYNQGRTDINSYIDALNFFFNAQIDYSRAVGDYQIALNEWAAIREELIPDQPKEQK